METIVVATWLAIAAILLGPPLLGVHRSAWPLESEWTPEPRPADEEPTAGAPTPAGQCRVCGEGGQAGYTFCGSCLTPLPQHREGGESDSRDGHPAD